MVRYFVEGNKSEVFRRESATKMSRYNTDDVSVQFGIQYDSGLPTYTLHPSYDSAV